MGQLQDSKVDKFCAQLHERSQFLPGENERGLEMSLRSVPSEIHWRKRHGLDVGWERK